jgi:hypothetical protein
MKNMTADFVTLKTFNKSMKNIDKRFEAVDKKFELVDKRFDEMVVMIRESMEEQRVFFTNEMSRHIGAVMEEFHERFKALYEHPVFANHKA